MDRGMFSQSDDSKQTEGHYSVFMDISFGQSVWTKSGYDPTNHWPASLRSQVSPA